MPGEAATLLLLAAGDEETAQRGEEDLTVVGRHQVVEHWVHCRAHVEQHVSHHVEVMIEVVQATA